MFINAGNNVAISQNGFEVAFFRGDGAAKSVSIGEEVGSISSTLTMGVAAANTTTTISMRGPNVNTFNMGLNTSTGNTDFVMASAARCRISIGNSLNTTSKLETRQVAAPTAAFGGSASASAVTVGSTDFSGEVSITDNGAAQGTGTFTFAVAYTAAPFVTVTPGNAAAANLQGSATSVFVTSNATTFTITYPVGLTGGACLWNYICIG
jgi:hypothetical protein